MRAIIVAVVRVAVGGLFVVQGIEKFAHHNADLRDFEHWGVPAASTAVFAVGGLEVIAGLLLALGLATRLAALLLLFDMLGAAATAGRVDGGARLVVPALLVVILLVLAARGGGAWQLLDRIDPPEATHRSL
jgi:uncharacterized membrane protein YphA (DoxX/SURF4 family)